ncbi:MAG: DUF11 domain-containing protein, partial [Parvularculaceae bacterium]|nr:DUF11 domain-containing protein [Parvularculaceae bacterium]
MRLFAGNRTGRRLLAALGVLLLGAGAAQAQSGPYQSTAAATINNAVACPASISRQIHVAESFTISDLDVGFLATHTYRSDIQLELTPPWGGSPVRLLQGLGYSGLGYDNYNVLLNDESSTLVNTGFHASNDNASAPPYQNDVRPSNPLSAFDGNNAQGDWTLTICDTYGPLDNGEFLQADLFFNRIDLSLSKTVSTSTPAAGANFTYTITVSNAGPSAATGVSVMDALPTGITHVSDSGAGAYVPATGIWTIAGSIAPGASRSLTITVAAAYNGSYTNTAEVYTAAGGDMDSTPGNSASAPSEDDTASVAVTVSGGPPAPPMCQPGLLLVNSSGNALSQTNTGVISPDRAVGGLTPAGTSPPDAYAALLNQSS